MYFELCLFAISFLVDGHGVANPKGLNYYNNLIDQLVAYGFTRISLFPFVSDKESTTMKEKQRGRIGITLLGFWFEPMTNSPRDIATRKRTLDFSLVGKGDMHEHKRLRLVLIIIFISPSILNQSPYGL
ncbi:hypothetical protein IFM89_037635 [Coptis chinensis]|uniref:Uncharacterized protein n=1 Tax=Coptis chinensis TaxID=261450 RepID=A0A835IT35_9MAGN|nr:hypothetical protein IFM89_037635 [Coptis chinensis]